MSSSSEALLDHIANFLKSMSSPIRSPHCRCRRNAAAAIECPPSATIERRLHRPPLPPPPPPALSTASMSYIGEERGSTTTPTSEPMAAPSWTRLQVQTTLTYLTYLQYLKFSDYQVVSVKNTKPFSQSTYSEMSHLRFWGVVYLRTRCMTLVVQILYIIVTLVLYYVKVGECQNSYKFIRPLFRIYLGRI
jgi:hypothetical protein